MLRLELSEGTRRRAPQSARTAPVPHSPCQGVRRADERDEHILWPCAVSLDQQVRVQAVFGVEERAESEQQRAAQDAGGGEADQEHDHRLVLGRHQRRRAAQHLPCHHARDAHEADDIHRVEGWRQARRERLADAR